jgi:2-oxoisovalerate dehydrogenase E1 component
MHVPVAPHLVENGHAPRAALAPDVLREAYRVAVHSRALEEQIVRLVSRGEVKFAIWGPGEEVHGTATALALRSVVGPDRFGFVAHYRSGALCSMWCALNGVQDFTRRMLRQQFSKGTDEMSGGRQMVYHLNLPEVGILPVQSPVGMQLGKAAGWALGYRKKGITDGMAMAVVGDGTTAEGDLHDAMNAARVWRLPLLVLVTDNSVAISTRPDEGRGIVDFAAYAAAFDFAHFTCDGRDFTDTYEVTRAAALLVRGEQRPALLHVKDLPRFNGHSSAADVTFDLSQADPLVAFGAQLVEAGVLESADCLVRTTGSGRDFFAHHTLGRVMEREDAAIRGLIDQVRAEPDPDASTLFDHVLAPFPTNAETPADAGRSTSITYAGGIRSALDKLITRHNGVILGQDVGRLGGVMTATAGLQARHGRERVIDSPLNEPLIVGTATGMGLHDGVLALPEIQFGDYSLNAFHWLVYLGLIRWSNLGKARSRLILRMPTDPFGGGAMYHSMSVDGYFSSIPGLVVLMPSTTFDVHGLLLTAGDYDGPVVCLEPKWMYRQALGPALPGEPQDADAVASLKKSIMRGEVPDLADVRVPFGKAAVRRAGRDVTVVAWGRAVWTCMAAARTLAEQGIEAEVLDLRTLVPPDLDALRASVGRTRRLVVAAENRVFGGFVREIQGAIVQEDPDVRSVAIGQKNIPGIAQSIHLEEHTVLTEADVVAAATGLVSRPATVTSGWSYLPPRYFVR